MEIPLWFSNLTFWSVQVAILVLAAGFLARVLKLRQPRLLLAYWRSLLAVSLLLPFIQPWHRPRNRATALISDDFASIPLPPPSTPADTHWHLPGLQTIASLLGVAILAGIVLRFAILALGLLKLRRLRQASTAILPRTEFRAALETMGILVAAPAEFRLSAQVDSPVTFGILSPVVLLPERFASLDPRFQSAIACHELLHVRRRDWVHHLGEEVLRALFWFHPAIAWVVSRVRLAREQVVDLEVVRLTNARKPYLEALLEFTNGRASLAAIPAPPFLAERQLVERVALMLKEVRMSRRRLIVSLSLVSCCLALVVALAARTFPLKAAPRAALKNAPQQDLGAAVPILRRIRIQHHDFDNATVNDAAMNALEARLNQLPDRLRAEIAYDPAEADKMKRALEDFWRERGITVEVRTTLTPLPRPPHQAVLQFDVYQQTVLPGKLDGGVPGGVAGGLAQGISHGVAGGVSKGIVEGVGEGLSQGVSEGISGGIAGGISGGISGRIRSHASEDEPSVDISTIWLDTVKRGPMLRQVRGKGMLARADGSENLVANITLPAFLAVDVHPNQNAAIDAHIGLVKGHVMSVNPGSSDETRTVNIALDAALPAASSEARKLPEVVATIDVEKLENILYVGRPVNGRQNSEINLFKIINNGAEAVRTSVKLGRTSVTTIEVLDGLKEGDKVILSDTSSMANAERIRLTDEKHLRSH